MAANCVGLIDEANRVPPHPPPHFFFGLPSAFGMVVKAVIYAVGTALTALGGFHGYRGYRGGRFSRQQAEAELLRDEFVFGDDLDKMYNEDPTRLDGDEAYKQNRAGDAKLNRLSTPVDASVDDRGRITSASASNTGDSPSSNK